MVYNIYPKTLLYLISKAAILRILFSLGLHKNTGLYYGSPRKQPEFIIQALCCTSQVRNMLFFELLTWEAFLRPQICA